MLGLGCAGFWIACKVLFGADPNETIMNSVPHWPSVGILLVPLLYQPVTTFLNEMEEIAGARRRKKDNSPAGRGEKKGDGQ